MFDSSAALIVSSFVAGVFTFFAPCTLPLVPAFLAVIAGARQEELMRGNAAHVRFRVFSNAVFYVLGFSLVFVLFGVFFSFLGRLELVRMVIQRVGGILVILFGLFFIGWLKISWLSAEKQIRVAKLFQKASGLNSFVIGILFALGWSPCVGPLLGAILLLATGTATVAQGTFLLIMFSIGLALPFLLTAFFIGKAFTAFGRWDRLLRVVNVVAGVFLVILGVLLVSDQFSRVFSFITESLSRLRFYEELINRFL
ncbi:MAG: cytochrome c biogenesis protein CcdA [Candidatus Paceibacterota bacterium]